MSAWAQLVNADGSDEHLALCSEALIEIQTEHARQLAERQRAASVVGRCGVACGDEYCESCNTHKLIDLIDPEVST